MKAELSFEQERFQRWLKNTLATSKMEASKVVQREFKGVIAKAFLVTPPMSGNTFAQGYRASKNAIKRDTGLVFKAVSDTISLESLKRRGATSPPMGFDAALKWYKSIQKPNKQPKGGFKKRLIFKSALDAVRTNLISTIGVTPSGWCVAADQLGIRYPEWIAKNKGKVPGSYKFNATKTRLEIAAKNFSNHSQSAYIQNILNRAFALQANAMKRRIVSAIDAGRVKEGTIDWGKQIK